MDDEQQHQWPASAAEELAQALAVPTQQAEQMIEETLAAFAELPPGRSGHVPGVDPYDLAGSA